MIIMSGCGVCVAVVGGGGEGNLTLFAACWEGCLQELHAVSHNHRTQKSHMLQKILSRRVYLCASEMGGSIVQNPAQAI